MPPASKRRKTESSTIEEISFDQEARQDYLSGFHKRKLQRAKHAQEIAEKKARDERIAERREIRKERKQDLERHVAQVNALLRPATEESKEASSASDGDVEPEWDGVSELPEIDHEAEYIDEDRYTTVTIEAMDVSTEGLHKLEETQNETSRADEKQIAKTEVPDNRQVRRVWTKEKPQRDGPAPKKKRKKFRYENRTERKLTRIKEKSKNSKQAQARRSG